MIRGMNELIVEKNGRKKQSPRAHKTQQHILTEAKRLFSQNGVENTTTKDIAKAAGVAEGTVFLHFDNKQGLINWVVIDFYATLQARSESIMGRDADSFQKLRSLIKNQLEMMAADWQLGRIIFGRHGRYVNNAFADEFVKLNRNYVRLYSELLDDLKQQGRIRSSTPNPLIRDTLLGSMEHYAIAHFARKRPYDLDLFVNQLFDLVFFGCGQRQL